MFTDPLAKETGKFPVNLWWKPGVFYVSSEILVIYHSFQAQTW